MDDQPTDTLGVESTSGSNVDSSGSSSSSDSFRDPLDTSSDDEPGATSSSRSVAGPSTAEPGPSNSAATTVERPSRHVRIDSITSRRRNFYPDGTERPDLTKPTRLDWANYTRMLQDFWLEDKTGDPFHSTYHDLNNRMTLKIRHNTSWSTHMWEAFSVYSCLQNRFWGDDEENPLTIVTFTKESEEKQQLVFIVFPKDERNDQYLITKYLVRVEGDPLRRRFQSKMSKYVEFFTWSYQGDMEMEWVCRNDEGVIVADYSLRLPGELCYDSSGNLFTVKEDWGDLAPEFLSTAMIMRYMKLTGIVD